MDSVKVSVIIPVMNQEHYLASCLESVVNQSLKEIEIILVEGGSKDNTADIIYRYMDTDDRISVLHKPAEGLPKARQAGLKKAVGEYILYLDGDDRLEPDALELLYNRGIEADADMVVLNFWLENQYNNTRREAVTAPFVRFSGIDFIRSIFKQKSYWMVWSVLHKRKLYDNNIQFATESFLGEDTLLTTQLAYYSRKVMKVDTKPLLHHYIRKAPEEKRLSFTEKDYFDLDSLSDRICSFFKEKPEYEQLCECVDSLRLQAITRSFTYHYYDCARERSREALGILKRRPSLCNIAGKKMEHVFQAFSLSESFGRLMARVLL
jgi:glycosyltransferase involved in cell wall biosynthesis